ncbi:MAG: hypothetical protein ACLFPD_11715, partial [Desulfosudaceae bacterium]
LQLRALRLAAAPKSTREISGLIVSENIINSDPGTELQNQESVKISLKITGAGFRAAKAPISSRKSRYSSIVRSGRKQRAFNRLTSSAETRKSLSKSSIWFDFSGFV